MTSHYDPTYEPDHMTVDETASRTSVYLVYLCRCEYYRGDLDAPHWIRCINHQWCNWPGLYWGPMPAHSFRHHVHDWENGNRSLCGRFVDRAGPSGDRARKLQPDDRDRVTGQGGQCSDCWRRLQTIIDRS